jgi:hypothetical protein|tara:strand:- start:3337 stop:3564 length:228 start_codon:yes stop_codon:yes gene_type:complete
MQIKTGEHYWAMVENKKIALTVVEAEPKGQDGWILAKPMGRRNKNFGVNGEAHVLRRNFLKPVTGENVLEDVFYI